MQAVYLSADLSGDCSLFTAVIGRTNTALFRRNVQTTSICLLAWFSQLTVCVSVLFLLQASLDAGIIEKMWNNQKVSPLVVFDTLILYCDLPYYAVRSASALLCLQQLWFMDTVL